MTTSRSALVPFAAFAVMGVTGALGAALVPAARVIFALSLSEALTLQWGALVMCGVAALPVARLVHAVGAGQAMAGGLALSTLASLGAWLALRPGLLSKAWGFHAFLAALMLVAVANTALQVACNTVLAQQGDPARRTARMTLAQGFNALGVFGGVQLAALLVLGRDNPAGLTDGTRLAYLGCALLSAVILAVALRRAPRGAAPSENEPDVAPVRQALRSRWAWAGAAAIALYVGAEGAVGGMLVVFLHDRAVLGLPLGQAGQWVAIAYWGGALAGRFGGGWLLVGRSDARVLTACAAAATLACVLAATAPGIIAGASALAIGLCNAVMFPVILALTLRRASAPPAAVTGLASMATAGGALVSIAAGWVADHLGPAAAFGVPALAYLAVSVFALVAGAARPPQDSRTTSSVGRRTDSIA